MTTSAPAFAASAALADSFAASRTTISMLGDFAGAIAAPKPNGAGTVRAARRIRSESLLMGYSYL